MSKAAISKPSPGTSINGFRPQPNYAAAPNRSVGVKNSPTAGNQAQMNKPAPSLNNSRPSATPGTTSSNSSTSTTNPPNRTNTTTPNATAPNNSTQPQEQRTRPTLARNSYMSKSSPHLANAIRSALEPTPTTPQSTTPTTTRPLGPVRPCTPGVSPSTIAKMPQGPGSAILATVTAKPAPPGAQAHSARVPRLGASAPYVTNNIVPSTSPRSEVPPISNTPSPTTNTNNPSNTTARRPGEPAPVGGRPNPTTNTPKPAPGLGSAQRSGPLPAVSNVGNKAEQDKGPPTATPAQGPATISNLNSTVQQAGGASRPTNPAGRPGPGNGSGVGSTVNLNGANSAKPAPPTNNPTNNPGSVSPRTGPIRAPPISPAGGNNNSTTNNSTPNNTTTNPATAKIAASGPVPITRGPRPGVPGNTTNTTPTPSGGPSPRGVGATPTPTAHNNNITNNPRKPPPSMNPFPTVQQNAVPVAAETTFTAEDNNTTTDTTQPSTTPSSVPARQPARPPPRPGVGYSAPASAQATQQPQQQPAAVPEVSVEPAAGGEEEWGENGDGYDAEGQQLKRGTKKLPPVPQVTSPGRSPPSPSQPPRVPQRGLPPVRTQSEKFLSPTEKQEMLRNRKPPPRPPQDGELPAATYAPQPPVKPTRSTTLATQTPSAAMSMYMPSMGQAGAGSPARGPVVQSHYVEVGGSLQKGGNAGTRVFGVGLDELRYKSKIGVPVVLKKLLDGVENLGGFEQEGLFRIPGTETEKVALRKQFDSGNFLISPEHSVHSVATLVKDWLRSLTTPIVPMSLYDKALTNVTKPEDTVKLIQELPEQNRTIVVYLISYLKRLLDPDIIKVTRMDVDNYATAFGPCFFMVPEDVNDNLEKLYSSLQNQKKFMGNVLNMRDEIVKIGSAEGAAGNSLSSKAKSLTRTVSTKFSKWQEMSMKKAAARRRINSQKKQRISDAAKDEKEAKSVQNMLAEAEETDGP